MENIFQKHFDIGVNFGRIDSLWCDCGIWVRLQECVSGHMQAFGGGGMGPISTSESSKKQKQKERSN